jgi:hypothetical protein
MLYGSQSFPHLHMVAKNEIGRRGYPQQSKTSDWVKQKLEEIRMHALHVGN